MYHKGEIASSKYSNLFTQKVYCLLTESKALCKALIFLCQVKAETASETMPTITLNNVPIIHLLYLLGSPNLGSKRGILRTFCE